MAFMRRPGETAKYAAAISAMVKERFALAEEDAVMVHEVNCLTPGCPPIETCVFFWKAASERYKLRFFKPIAQVSADDLPPKWLLPGLVDEGEECC